MRAILKTAHGLSWAQSGAAIVEYVALSGTLAFGVTVALLLLGTNTRDTFGEIQAGLEPVCQVNQDGVCIDEGVLSVFIPFD